MKRLTIAVLAITFSASAALAQQAAEVAAPTTQTTPATAESKVTTAEKTPPLIKETVITASGFLVELKRAENKKEFLSLRKKADPIKDSENLLREPKSGRPIGFRLFSLNF